MPVFFRANNWLWQAVFYLKIQSVLKYWEAVHTCMNGTFLPCFFCSIGNCSTQASPYCQEACLALTFYSIDTTSWVKSRAVRTIAKLFSSSLYLVPLPLDHMSLHYVHISVQIALTYANCIFMNPCVNYTLIPRQSIARPVSVPDSSNNAPFTKAVKAL